MNETVLADVRTGAGLGLHYGAGAALFIADDAKLRWFHTAWQVHIKHRAQLLQQLRIQKEILIKVTRGRGKQSTKNNRLTSICLTMSIEHCTITLLPCVFIYLFIIWHHISSNGCIHGKSNSISIKKKKSNYDNNIISIHCLLVCRIH